MDPRRGLRNKKAISFSHLDTPFKDETRDTKVVLDVGGRHFRTTTVLLKQLPNTRLGRMCMEGRLDYQTNGEVFFDRNSDVMNSILGLYRTGELHLPSNICYSVVEEELHFFEIPVELVSACCWRHFENNRNERRVVNEMQRFLQGPYPNMASIHVALTWGMKLWFMLERPRHSLFSKMWSAVFFCFVFMSIITFVFETDCRFRVPTEHFENTYLVPKNQSLAEAFEKLSTMHFMAVTLPALWLRFSHYMTFSFFITDFMLRLATCPDRKQFFKQSRNWLEIFIALKTVFTFIIRNYIFASESDKISRADSIWNIMLYSASGIRVMRILYLANLFPGLKIVVLSFKTSMKDLTMTLFCATTFVITFSTATYIAESLEDIKSFTSMFDAMWWGIITMTTVGYGDITPKSAAGRISGSLCALAGVVALALPIAVITINFTRYHDHARSFRQGVTRKTFLRRNPRYSTFRCSVSAEASSLDLPASLRREPYTEQKYGPRYDSTVSIFKEEGHQTQAQMKMEDSVSKVHFLEDSVSKVHFLEDSVSKVHFREKRAQECDSDDSHAESQISLHTAPRIIETAASMESFHKTPPQIIESLP